METEAKEKAEKKKYRILIVDDDEDVLNALFMTLKRTDGVEYDIILARNWKEALGALANRDFDLVLSDYKMPEVNGAELLAKVKEKRPRAKRVLITGYSDVHIAKEAVNKAQIHAYLEKPWDYDEIRDTIKNLVEGSV